LGDEQDRRRAWSMELVREEMKSLRRESLAASAREWATLREGKSRSGSERLGGVANVEGME